MNTRAVYHYHKRKRVYDENLEKYPSRKKWIRLMDKIIYIVGIFGPVMTVPQLVKIWIEQNAAGVSLLSWSGFIIYSLFWVTYGIIHKEKPIIFTHSLWAIMQFLIVIGVFIYG